MIALPPDGPVMILAIYSDKPLGLKIDANEIVNGFVPHLRAAVGQSTSGAAVVSAYDMIEVAKH